MYVAWIGFTGTSDAIFITHSGDGGVTFDEPPVLLGEASSSNAFFQDLALAAVGDAVYVVWLEETQTNDQTISELQFTRRPNLASSFQPPVPIVSRDLDLVQTSNSPILGLAIAATTELFEDAVYLVWHEQTRVPSVDVSFLKITIQNQTETLSQVQTLQTHTSRFVFYNPSVAAVDQQVSVAWVNVPDDGPFIFEIFGRHSGDKGETFAAQVKVGDQPARRPSIAASATQVVVSWERSGEIFFVESRDQGATYTTERNLSVNAGNSTFPALAVAGENVFVAWEDRTSGSPDILFRAGKPTPVVILPGIMGSELTNSGEVIWLDAARAAGNGDDLFLDELLLDANGQSAPQIAVTRLMRGGPAAPPFRSSTNIYDDFINFLITNGGYTERTEAANGTLSGTLFPCPYDWRLDVQYLTTTLEACIDDALMANPDSDKVDIVGHSTGGLVARAYVAEKRADKINKIIYLATPHQGSPRAFNALAFDDGLIRNFVDFDRLFGRPVINNQTLSNVVKTFPSVFQLLPRYPFVWDVQKSKKLSLGETYIDTFIADTHLSKATALHSQLQSDPNLLPVEQFNIIGSGVGTLESIGFGPGRDGTIEWRPSPQTGTNGDGTVPLGSAARLRGTNVTPLYVDSGALNALHDALPNNEQVSELVKRLLRDESPQDSTGTFFNDAIATTPFVPEGDEVKIWWYTESPVRVTISDTFGNVNGLDTEGNLQRGIPLSSFFLFTTNEGGALLGGQDYFFTITALGAGEFSLVLRTMLGANTSAGTLRYENVGITAQSQATLALLANDPAPVLQLDIDGDGSVDTTINPVVIPALVGDFDGDGDVDQHDVNFILAARNTPALEPSDARDLDGDQVLTVLDARKLVLECTRPRCATQ